jgi:hypothetical protein
MALFPGVMHVHLLRLGIHNDQTGVKFAKIWKNSGSSLRLNVTHKAFHQSNMNAVSLPFSVLLERRDRNVRFLRYVLLPLLSVSDTGEAHRIRVDADRVDAEPTLSAAKCLHGFEVFKVILIIVGFLEVGNPKALNINSMLPFIKVTSCTREPT